MKSIFAVAAVALAVTGIGASAQEAQEEPDPNKKICRTTKMTGSLTRRQRICMTEAEWRALADRTRKGLEEMGQAASGGQAVANNAGAGGQ